LKPGVTFPAGDEERGLGAGKSVWSATVIATRNFDRGLWHLNVGYDRNANLADEREDVWRASVATERGLFDPLRAVLEVGVDCNPTRAGADPVHATGGVIYSFGASLDVDIGMRVGLNREATHRTVLAGVAARF
jgi:hypothetical protein